MQALPQLELWPLVGVTVPIRYKWLVEIAQRITLSSRYHQLQCNTMHWCRVYQYIGHISSWKCLTSQCCYSSCRMGGSQSNSPTSHSWWCAACASNRNNIPLKLQLSLKPVGCKCTRTVLSWDLQSPWISTIGSTEGGYRSKSSTEILQHTKCMTTSCIWSISTWKVLIGASFQYRYLTRRIYHRTVVNVVGTLQWKRFRVKQIYISNMQCLNTISWTFW